MYACEGCFVGPATLREECEVTGASGGQAVSGENFEIFIGIGIFHVWHLGHRGMGIFNGGNFT